MGSVAVLVLAAVPVEVAAQAALPPLPLPPAIMTAPVGRSAQTEPQPVRRLSVTMTLGREVIWSGALNVGGAVSANVSINEPIEDVVVRCGQPGRAVTPSRRITLSITPSRPFGGPENFRLSAQFSRPVDGGGCDGSNARTVSIQYVFALDKSGSQSFEGDGGFRVTIAPH